MYDNVLVSFDYSITSPAMCIWNGSRYRVFVVSSEKKIQPHSSDLFEITPLVYPIWTSPQERYHRLSDLLLKEIPTGLKEFGIESYSMGSRGRVFDIAEATQTLKYRVWTEWNQEMKPFAPTTVKKIFSGSGRGDKEAMAEAFRNRFGFWMHEAVSSKIKGSASDLVDSIGVNVCLQENR